MMNEGTFIHFYRHGVYDAEHKEHESDVYLNACKIISIEPQNDYCTVYMENDFSYDIEYGFAKAGDLTYLISNINSARVKYALLRENDPIVGPSWEICRLLNPTKEEIAKYPEIFNTREEAYAEGIKYYEQHRTT